MTNTALLLIDIQNDYFADGSWSLVNQEVAAERAAQLLQHFRSKELPVFHVRHIAATDPAPFFVKGTVGSEIHNSVSPLENEQVIIKAEINSFKGTDLLQALQEQKIEKLVVAGSMSHMCIDAAVRAASDQGFECVVAEDACATRDQEFNDTIVPAAEVHNAFMAALAFAYADVISTEETLSRI